MITQSRSLAVEKIIAMPEERVSKVLIFMAGMEAERSIDERKEANQPRSPQSNQYKGQFQRMAMIKEQNKDT